MRSFLIHRSLTTLKMKPVDRLTVPSIRVIDLDRGRGHVHTYACYIRTARRMCSSYRYELRWRNESLG